MKKGALSIFLLIASMGFASAQNTISDLLNQIDQSTVVLSAVFILSFSIIFFSLSKSVFKDNTSIAGIIAGVISFVIVYAVNQTGFDFQGFFFDIGVPTGVFDVIIPIVILAGVIFAVIKLKKDSLFLFGAILIVLGFFVFEGLVLWTFGAIAIIVRLFLGFKGGGKEITIKT